MKGVETGFRDSTGKEIKFGDFVMILDLDKAPGYWYSHSNMNKTPYEVKLWEGVISGYDVCMNYGVSWFTFPISKNKDNLAVITCKCGYSNLNTESNLKIENINI